ncbi:MAG: 2-hydroxychromene-2-carboxylate isomerase [Sphingomonadaceae bacterium]|nr:2-hydroxychromene-2-carboxylate isomerase [Sphingomonadaceae bacterium]
MPQPIEFLFDFVSPASYLAHCRLKGVAARTGASVEHVPVFLGGIMQATGNRPPGTVGAKGAWMARDLDRFAARDGVPFTMNPHFPLNTLPLLRIATAMRGEPRFMRFVDFAFDAMWHYPRNMADPAEVRALLANAGFDADAELARADSPEVKARLKAATDAAVARGVFGAPTFFVAQEMHFGQDRLDWVEAAAA